MSIFSSIGRNAGNVLAGAKVASPTKQLGGFSSMLRAPQAAAQNAAVQLAERQKAQAPMPGHTLGPSLAMRRPVPQPQVGARQAPMGGFGNIMGAFKRF